MTKKKFDAVAFMRIRRDELSKRWKNPTVQEKDLKKIRKKNKFPT
jgi:hypothetical protein